MTAEFFDSKRSQPTLELMLQRQLRDRERPWVLPLSIDRDARRRKARIGKRAHRHAHETRHRGGLPVNRRAAHRTETERACLAAVAGPGPLRRAPLDRHALPRKARLRTENAAGAFLAFEAMADGDANGFALAYEAKLSSAARSCSGGHGAYPAKSGFSLESFWNAWNREIVPPPLRKWRRLPATRPSESETHPLEYFRHAPELGVG
jgi:hypothetical protein